MMKMVNYTCLKCGGLVTGDQFDVPSESEVTQDVTCDDCGSRYTHHYILTSIEGGSEIMQNDTDWAKLTDKNMDEYAKFQQALHHYLHYLFERQSSG